MLVRGQVPIFEFHDLSAENALHRTFHSPYVLHVEKFRSHMELLCKLGFCTISIDDLFSERIPAKAVILTFDDGHLSNYELAFRILREFGFFGTFFVVAEYLGKSGRLSLGQIIEMKEAGMRVGSHSLTHPYLVELGKPTLLHEIIESKRRLEQIVSGEVENFSVPYGFYNRSVIECIQEAGYKSVVTEEYGYHRLNQREFKILPRFTIRAGIELCGLKNILEGKRLLLSKEYARHNCLRFMKSVLGYKRYLYLKSLILKIPHP